MPWINSGSLVFFTVFSQLYRAFLIISSIFIYQTNAQLDCSIRFFLGLIKIINFTFHYVCMILEKLFGKGRFSFSSVPGLSGY